MENSPGMRYAIGRLAQVSAAVRVQQMKGNARSIDNFSRLASEARVILVCPGTVSLNEWRVFAMRSRILAATSLSNM
jgi:hypothetical protein